VAVKQNLQALSLGRLALGAPQALQRLAGGTQQSADWDTLDGEQGLIARRQRFLHAYDGPALVGRYAALVQSVRQAESSLGGEAAPRLDLTRTVARQYARLLAVKDEYEVARLHLSPEFESMLGQQFERWDRVVHHLAPPLLSPTGPDGRPQKRAFGPWVRSAFKLLVRLKFLRGTALDPFGHTHERRLERQLAQDYERVIRHEILPRLNTNNVSAAVHIADSVRQVRGFGPVKLAQVAIFKAQWASLRQAWHAGDSSTRLDDSDARPQEGATPRRVIHLRSES
jgi:indolepyruvate ferredoxin oxidoreductase